MTFTSPALAIGTELLELMRHGYRLGCKVTIYRDGPEHPVSVEVYSVGDIKLHQPDSRDVLTALTAATAATAGMIAELPPLTGLPDDSQAVDLGERVLALFVMASRGGAANIGGYFAVGEPPTYTAMAVYSAKGRPARNASSDSLFGVLDSLDAALRKDGVILDGLAGSAAAA